MISTKELTKLYYSISEVSKMFGLSNSTLRYWESEFSVLKPKKNRHGERAYTKKDIGVVSNIFTLVKERGFTIDGAKKEIANAKKQSPAFDKEKLLKKLIEVKTKMEDLLNDINSERSPE